MERVDDVIAAATPTPRIVYMAENVPMIQKLTKRRIALLQLERSYCCSRISATQYVL
jgi:hypothetical protein